MPSSCSNSSLLAASLLAGVTVSLATTLSSPAPALLYLLGAQGWSSVSWPSCGFRTCSTSAASETLHFRAACVETPGVAGICKAVAPSCGCGAAVGQTNLTPTFRRPEHEEAEAMPPTAPISSVLLAFAMEAEASPLITKLGLTRDEPSKTVGPAPCITYSGTHGSLRVHVVWNGKCAECGVDNVGTVPAAVSSYLAIQALNPDLVISAGTAGGFKAQGAAIGDIFLSSATVNHDRRIPIPGFDKYGVGHTNSTPCPALQSALGFKLGVVSSGNSLDYTDKCMELMSGNKAAVKEMEAAAIAWVCSLYNKPLICVKAITDIVDGDRPTQDEFLENLTTAATSLKAALPRVLDFVAGKTVAEL